MASVTAPPPPSSSSSDNDGKCPIHPVIQLKRKQRRTGEWKVILTNCPLCASGLPATTTTTTDSLNLNSASTVGDENNNSSSRGEEAMPYNYNNYQQVTIPN